MNQNNPLLTSFGTPEETIPFNKVDTAHYQPAIEQALTEAREDIEAIKNNNAAPDFENTIEALEAAGRRLNNLSSVFFSLNNADTNEEMQQIARNLSPQLTEFSSDIILDETLFQKVKTVWQQRDNFQLSPEQRTLLRNNWLSFSRNGSGLSDEKKQELRDINKKLSDLSLTFGEHVLADTNNYQLEIKDESRLSGLPTAVVAQAAERAKEAGKENSWLFTLHFPVYVAVMTYADDRDLREELLKAFASKGMRSNENNNEEIVKEISRLRHQRANLLGYDTHAHYVLEERMAGSPEKVFSFLKELEGYALPVANDEKAELQDFANSRGLTGELQRWDSSYYSEKLKQEKFQLDDELLKPFFELDKVVQGVYEVAKRLYGLQFTEASDIDVYHKDVTAYRVHDADGKMMGIFYTDFFPRAGKRDGAWMTVFREQYEEHFKDIRPHVSIVCNFTEPTADTPSLLTFNEVSTLFHEFGHALHGLLAEGKYQSLSGTNVYWDFVELPSQLMENWLFEKDCLDLFAKHYQTGEAIPAQYIKSIKESANFQNGMQTIRQIGLGLIDFGWHATDTSAIENVEQYELALTENTRLLPHVSGTSTSCQFSHIFQGGYSAGYYSYKWAEVLDADAFDFISQKGIFDQPTAALFRKHVLSAGGSEHPMTLYKRFRGQEPELEPLLRRGGLLK
jgi:peptidyl-dipeptidase Dcp